MSIARSESVVRFANLATVYCDLLESRPLSRKKLLREAGYILPELLAAALKLPVGRESKRISRELRQRSYEIGDTSWDVPKGPKARSSHRYDHTFISIKQYFSLDKRLRRILGKYDLYHEIFDPYRDVYPIRMTLACDLAEIWHNVKPELLLFRTGEETAMRHAVHRWGLNVRIHWGMNHCADAMKAVYFALTDSDDYWNIPHLERERTRRRRKKK
ncbi:hypothetical protein B7486_14180 [cyanobacterium TDX16]|nr:hypothetical protein B7486_14180 [cyanobacterium TDX16]